MRKRRVTSVISDRALLVVVAIAVGAGLLGIVYVLTDYLRLSEAWMLFTLGSLLYAFTSFYLAFTGPFLKRHQRTFHFSITLIFLTAVPILLAFITFYFSLAPLPNGLLPYLIGTIVLAPAPSLCAKYWLRERQERSTS